MAQKSLRIALIGAGLLAGLAVGGSLWVFFTATRASPEALARARQHLNTTVGPDRTAIAGLAVVDFSRPAWHRRLALYDEDGDLVGTFLVAHARESGDYVMASRFSNENGSNQSSLGLYRVLGAYEGQHGRALRLEGLDPGLNDRAFERDIVVHGADYVSFGSILDNLLQGKGPGVGRSLGCPAVSRNAIDPVIETLPDGSYLYVHF